MPEYSALTMDKIGTDETIKRITSLAKKDKI
jgi:hypothetical protein